MEESKATNLSQIKRRKMLETLKKIKQNISDEETLNNLSLIENELNEKKYGLIWEEHEERVDKELETQIPVFQNVAEKEIVSDEKLKYNFLLEGDNLHSLYLLEKTHKNNIDVIYIDPPYNTGHNDFKYNDGFIGVDDEFRHSKWLSFMNRRLQIAKNLLAENGIITISIDDNECAQLKSLCDDIFGHTNCIGVLPTIMNLKGNQDQFAFAGTHEYTLVYAKDIQKCTFGQFSIDDDEIEREWDEDEIGYYKKGANLKATGVNAPRQKRPNLFFPIYVKYDEQTQETVWDVEPISGATEVLPITDGAEMSWRWSKEKFTKERHNVIVSIGSGNTFAFYKKQRPILGDLPTKKPKSLLYKPEYSSGNGTNQIVKIFGYKAFNNPKPVDLIKDFLRIELPNNNGLVLDFFAGSGTTAQAVMELNKEDGGNRQFILCTNNENNICEDITYQRIQTVITGNRQDGSKYSDGLTANLKYYKTSYVPRIDTEEENLHNNLLANIKNLIQLENGINIDDKSIKVFLDEEEFDKMTADKDALDECDKVYISSDILMTGEQEKILENNNIDVFAIPEYYFKDEIVEVTE